MTSAPDPASESNAPLVALIGAEIDAGGGWMPFSRFMELALYAPGLGYYSAGAVKLGADPRDGSDFVTAPELTPLFARALAAPLAEVLADGGTTVLELGAGSGRLAADLLHALESRDALPAEYLVLEVSADLRERQAATLQRDVPHLAGRVRWIECLPDRIDGVVIGNEVLDAIPIDLVVRDESAWLARGVARAGGDFRFADRVAEPRLMVEADRATGAPDALPRGYVAELHLQSSALVATLASRLGEDSLLLLIDYGFPASEYYHPQRSQGTLMAHRRHRASAAVFEHPGLQDITTHVDFSAVAAAARDAGGVVVGYTSQAAFLIDCGVVDLLLGDAADPRVWAPQAAALQTLLSEAEMGELFKVIAIGRRQRDLPGFGRSDRRASLEVNIQNSS